MIERSQVWASTSWGDGRERLLVVVEARGLLVECVQIDLHKVGVEHGERLVSPDYIERHYRLLDAA